MSRQNLGSITWKTETTPQSDYFGDIYFSPEDGLAESKYVFLEGVGIPTIWHQDTLSPVYHIGETGFGTGLNFLNCWSQWDQYQPQVRPTAYQRLHFISVEAYPLQKQDLARALSGFHALDSYVAKLLDIYPEPTPHDCWHHWHLCDTVELSLLIGRATDSFQQLVGTFQAWFLDGFSPANNPDMWSPELFTEIARLSEPGTHLATFTAARAVRRGLEAVGFDIQRRSGYGRKRHMSYGTFKAPSLDTSVASNLALKSSTPVSKIAIIGAGIAGANCAAGFARRGIDVDLFDSFFSTDSKSFWQPNWIDSTWLISNR